MSVRGDAENRPWRVGGGAPCPIRLIARGVAIVEPIGDRDYGMRDFAVTDPDGHRLVFGQEISEGLSEQ